MGASAPLFFFVNYNLIRWGRTMSSIQILAKKGNKTVVVSDAKNKKDAKNQVDYWRGLKGKSWRITSKPK